MAEPLRNPFDRQQRPGAPKTLKWCLWEVLARHWPRGARLGDLLADARLLDLRPSLRTSKNPSGQVSGELGADKGEHFVRDFDGTPGLWAAQRQPEERRTAGHAAAPARSPRREARHEALHEERNEGRQEARHGARHEQQQQRHDKPPQKSAAEVPPPQGQQRQGSRRGHHGASPPAPGNKSTMPPWEGATCDLLGDRLTGKDVSVWWQGERRYFEGRILDTLTEEGTDLLLFLVRYDDGTEEWIRPIDFTVSGRDPVIAVVRDYSVYLYSPEARRLVPDPDQGEERPQAGEQQAQQAQQHQHQHQHQQQQVRAAERREERPEERRRQDEQRDERKRQDEQRGRSPCRPERQEGGGRRGGSPPTRQQQQRQEPQPEKKRRREEDGEWERQHKRPSPQLDDRPGRPAAVPGGGAAKPLSIPKRPHAEQQQQPAAAADGGKGKAGGVPLPPPPFRIPKSTAAAAAPAPHEEPHGSKQPHAEAAGPVDDRRRKQQQGARGQQEARGRQGPASPQRAADRDRDRGRARSPPPPQRVGVKLLRANSSTLSRSLANVRWAVPAAEAKLPPPSQDAPAKVAAAQQQLAAHLACGGTWPHGATLLPALPAAPGSAAAAAAEHLPDAWGRWGRVFVCKRETLTPCMDRSIFISNSTLDMEGLEVGMLALLHSLDEKLVYGCFRVVEFGVALDKGFPAGPEFRFHIRVAPVRLFQPVPADLLDMFLQRKIKPQTGELTKFFDRHLSHKQCKQVWELFKCYEGKLHPELDMRSRFGAAFGVGWERALQRQAREAAASAARA